MSLTGACRFIAAFVRCGFFAAIAAVLWPPVVSAADCDQSLSRQERVSRFKDLDQNAESAMRGRRYSEAVQLYQEAVCLVPDSPRGLYGLGMAQAAAGNFLGARDSFQASDRLQPTAPSPLIMQARVNFSLHDMDALKSNLRDIALRFPNDAEAHETLARFLAEQNLFVLALGEALRSTQVRDGSPASRLQLAVLENTAGAYEDSIRNGIAIEQDHSLPNELRGSAAGIAGLSYESLGQTEPAIRYLKEAIELDPSHDNSYLALADLFEQAQRYPEAVEILERARANIPGSMNILLPLGADLICAERYREGIAILNELLRQSPETAEAYVGLADAGRRMGEAAAEANALQTLERLRPDYPMIHVLLARAMLNRQPPPYPKILDELSLAAAKAPGDPEVFYLQGKVYFALGRYEEALAPLQKSIQLRALDPAPYYQLAKAYQKLGKAELAHEQFERVRYLESVSPK